MKYRTLHACNEFEGFLLESLIEQIQSVKPSGTAWKLQSVEQIERTGTGKNFHRLKALFNNGTEDIRGVAHNTPTCWFPSLSLNCKTLLAYFFPSLAHLKQALFRLVFFNRMFSFRSGARCNSLGVLIRSCFIPVIWYPIGEQGDYFWNNSTEIAHSLEGDGLRLWVHCKNTETGEIVDAKLAVDVSIVPAIYWLSPIRWLGWIQSLKLFLLPWTSKWQINFKRFKFWLKMKTN